MPFSIAASVLFPFPRLRGKVGMGGFRQRFQDHVANTFDLFEDLIIPETKNPEAVPSQAGVADGVRCRVGMLSVIHFDDQPPFDACEIGDIRTDWRLAPESVSRKLAMAKASPQKTLGVGHVPPQSSSQVPFLALPHDLHLFIESME